jgi:phosphomannomutase
MLRGDELGALLGEYIARKSVGGILANSIVSSSILKKIAVHHSMEFRQTLTGFKWIAQIKGLTFGYEEALGYCVDSQSVNDKDGISAAIVLAQLATDLKMEGKTLLDLLDEIWLIHGYHGTEQISVRVKDMGKVVALIENLRSHPPTLIGGRRVLSIDDLNSPTDNLPPTDGLRLWLEGDIRVIIRPSGTEAKVKCYVEVITKGLNAKNDSDEMILQLKPGLIDLLSL